MLIQHQNSRRKDCLSKQLIGLSNKRVCQTDNNSRHQIPTSFTPHLTRRHICRLTRHDTVTLLIYSSTVRVQVVDSFRNRSIIHTFAIELKFKMDPTVVTKKKVALKSGSRTPSEDPPTDDTLSSLPSTPPPPITDDVTTAEVAAKALNDLASAASTTVDPQDSGLSPSPHPLLRKRLPSPLTSDLSGLSGFGGGGLLDDSDRLEMGDIFPPLTPRDTEDKSMASTVSYDEEVAGGFTGLRRRRTNTFSDDEIQNIPRLVHRNLPFQQSRQEIAVVNKTNYKSFKVQRILSQDWYHVFLRQPTWFSLCGLLLFWTTAIIVFALIYQKIDRDNPTTECGLGKVNEPISFTPAFAFSLETCTTVGYGLPNGSNGFFEPDCVGLQIAIYFQMTSSMLFNAFLFSFVFARLARCQARGAQVLFSDKAIMEVRDGRWMLHVRIYDFDAAQPLVEAHVRMYCVSWRDYQKQARDLVQPHLLHTMRILQPNDEFGAPLFPSIPANVTHQIDAFSPLAPFKMRKQVKYLPHAGLALREADQVNGSRHGVLCPVCGETFGTMDALKRHVQYLQLVEQKDNFPIIGSHRDVTLVKPKLFKPFLLTEADIREHLRDKEIMVVVEGIERKYFSLSHRVIIF